MELRIPEPEDVTAAALFGQVFAVYVVVLGLGLAPTETQWSEADPILGILPRLVSLWSVPLLSVVAVGVWWRIAEPSRDTLLRGALHAFAGLAVGVLAVGLLRLAVGPTLPSFIPSEESARPGFLLSMTAGYAEEVIFRPGLLPAAYFALRDRIPKHAAALVAALVTGLGFALLHDAGPGVFEMRFFLTRALIPGAAMSLAFVYVSPSFIVIAHASAHLLIPALFA